MRYVYILVIFYCFSCGQTRQLQSTKAEEGTYSIGGKIITSLFQQRAAEYKALCIQGYNLALLRIQEYKPTTNKPLAIITDIDETILDNSPYAVHQGLIGKEFDIKSWQEWTSLAAADTMPGAVDFLHKAAKKNVEIFYISNRAQAEQEGTLKNLQRFGLPNADAAHLLLKQETSSKEARRQKIMQDHEVILLMGDNLADFSSLWEKKTETERSSAVAANAGKFGDRFIVFPNANYGDWEGAFYKYNYNYTQAQKDSMLKAELRSY